MRTIYQHWTCVPMDNHDNDQRPPMMFYCRFCSANADGRNVKGYRDMSTSRMLEHWMGPKPGTAASIHLCDGAEKIPERILQALKCETVLEELRADSRSAPLLFMSGEMDATNPNLLHDLGTIRAELQRQEVLREATCTLIEHLLQEVSNTRAELHDLQLRASERGMRPEAPTSCHSNVQTPPAAGSAGDGTTVAYDNSMTWSHSMDQV